MFFKDVFNFDDEFIRILILGSILKRDNPRCPQPGSIEPVWVAPFWTQCFIKHKFQLPG